MKECTGVTEIGTNVLGPKLVLFGMHIIIANQEKYVNFVGNVTIYVSVCTHISMYLFEMRNLKKVLLSK